MRRTTIALMSVVALLLIAIPAAFAFGADSSTDYWPNHWDSMPMFGVDGEDWSDHWDSMPMFGAGPFDADAGFESVSPCHGALSSEPDVTG